MERDALKKQRQTAKKLTSFLSIATNRVSDTEGIEDDETTLQLMHLALSSSLFQSPIPLLEDLYHQIFIALAEIWNNSISRMWKRREEFSRIALEHCFGALVSLIDNTTTREIIFQSGPCRKLIFDCCLEIGRKMSGLQFHADFSPFGLFIVASSARVVSRIFCSEEPLFTKILLDHIGTRRRQNEYLEVMIRIKSVLDAQYNMESTDTEKLDTFISWFHNSANDRHVLEHAMEMDCKDHDDASVVGKKLTVKERTKVHQSRKYRVIAEGVGHVFWSATCKTRPACKYIDDNKYSSAAKRRNASMTQKESRKDSRPCDCLCLRHSACMPSMCCNAEVKMECDDEICSCGSFCHNRRIQRREYPQMSVLSTNECGYGIHLLQDVHCGDLIIEYVGDVITMEEYSKRHTHGGGGGDGKKKASRPHYCMLLPGGNVIDATKLGNVARFINHSCDPNCVTQVWTVKGLPRVGIFAKKDIEIGTELTYDYQFEYFGDEIPEKCCCGSKNCRGIIGSYPKGTPPAIRQYLADRNIDRPVDFPKLPAFKKRKRNDGTVEMTQINTQDSLDDVDADDFIELKPWKKKAKKSTLKSSSSTTKSRSRRTGSGKETPTKRRKRAVVFSSGPSSAPTKMSLEAKKQTKSKKRKTEEEEEGTKASSGKGKPRKADRSMKDFLPTARKARRVKK
jgi:hypothetical protein